MRTEPTMTPEDQEVLALIERISSQYEKYLELNTLKDLSDLTDSPKPIVHDWNTPLDIVWRQV